MSEDTQLRGELTAVREKLVEAQRKVGELLSSLVNIQQVIELQKSDPKLWLFHDPVLARYNDAQVALRKLHAAVENETQHIFVGQVDVGPVPPEDLL